MVLTMHQLKCQQMWIQAESLVMADVGHRIDGRFRQKWKMQLATAMVR